MYPRLFLKEPNIASTQGTRLSNPCDTSIDKTRRYYSGATYVLLGRAVLSVTRHGIGRPVFADCQTQRSRDCKKRITA